jgi:hypothetical protein
MARGSHDYTSQTRLCINAIGMNYFQSSCQIGQLEARIKEYASMKNILLVVPGIILIVSNVPV